MNTFDQQSARMPASSAGATNKTTDNTHLLTVPDLLDYLKVGRTALHHMLRDGLPRYRLGSQRALRFRRAEVDQWLESRREGDRVAATDEGGSSC